MIRRYVTQVLNRVDLSRRSQTLKTSSFRAQSEGVQKTQHACITSEPAEEWDFFRAERAKFMDLEHARRMSQLTRVLRSQKQAFDELRQDNRPLFLAAIQKQPQK